MTTVERIPRSLTLIVLAAAVFGALAAGAAYQSATTSQQARVEDVEANRSLIREVKVLQQQAHTENVAHRVANERSHRALCDVVVDIARQAHLDPPPCPPPLRPEDIDAGN